jgi:glycogen debranching enzyme
LSPKPDIKYDFVDTLWYRTGSPRFARPGVFSKNPNFINGLTDYEVEVREHLQVSNSNFLEYGESGDINITQLNFVNFQPGSIVAIR